MESIAALNARNYVTQIHRRGDVFHLVVPELGILVSDQNLAVANEKVEAEKQRLFKAAIEAGIVDTLAGPLIPETSNWVKQTGVFVAKATYVWLLIFLPILVTVLAVVQPIHHSVKDGLTGLKSDIRWLLSVDNNKQKAKAALLAFEEKAANIKNSPEKKARLHTFIQNVKPLTEELAELTEPFCKDGTKNRTSRK